MQDFNITSLFFEGFAGCPFRKISSGLRNRRGQFFANEIDELNVNECDQSSFGSAGSAPVLRDVNQFVWRVRWRAEFVNI